MVKAIKVTPDNQETIRELWGLGVDHLAGKFLVVREGYRKVILLGTYSVAGFSKRYEFVRTPAKHNFTEVVML